MVRAHNIYHEQQLMIEIRQNKLDELWINGREDLDLISRGWFEVKKER